MIKQYVSTRTIAKQMACDMRTARRIIEDMKKSGRYPRDTFLERPKRVAEEALLDFCERGY